MNAKMEDGETPLDAVKRHSETVDLLRKHGGKTGAELKAEGNQTKDCLMEPGIFCTIPVALLFFWLGWLLLKQLQQNIKDGEFQLKSNDSGDVTYIKRDKKPIVFHFFNSLCCMFVCVFFLQGYFFCSSYLVNYQAG